MSYRSLWNKELQENDYAEYNEYMRKVHEKINHKNYDDYDDSDLIPSIERYKREMEKQVKNEQIEIARIKKEKERVIKKNQLIEEMKNSIPEVVELRNRQEKLMDNIQFSLALETYSVGLLDMMKEYQNNEKILEEYYQLIFTLAKTKLGY
jgi:hypothetical protein